MLKLDSDQTFGETICSLIFCVNLQNHKESVWIIMIEGVLNMRPEVMPFDIETLGSGGDTLICSQQTGTLVVLTKMAVNFNDNRDSDLPEAAQFQSN